MPTIPLFLHILCLVCLGIPLGPAGHAAVAKTALAHAGSSIRGAEAVVHGISVTLEEATSRTSHLRIDLCGHDATRLLPGFPLGVEVHATVQSIVLRHAEAGLAVRASAEGPRATATLTRDPFLPPAPWRVALLLRVDGDLGAGRLLVGAARYPLPPSLPVGRSTVVLGPGCDERYARELVPGRGGRPA